MRAFGAPPHGLEKSRKTFEQGVAPLALKAWASLSAFAASLGVRGMVSARLCSRRASFPARQRAAREKHFKTEGSRFALRKRARISLKNKLQCRLSRKARAQGWLKTNFDVMRAAPESFKFRRALTGRAEYNGAHVEKASEESEARK